MAVHPPNLREDMGVAQNSARVTQVLVFGSIYQADHLGTIFKGQPYEPRESFHRASLNSSAGKSSSTAGLESVTPTWMRTMRMFWRSKMKGLQTEKLPGPLLQILDFFYGYLLENLVVSLEGKPKGRCVWSALTILGPQNGQC